MTEKEQLDSFAIKYKTKRFEALNPCAQIEPPIEPPISSFQKYVNSWLDQYPFLVKNPWRSLSQTINTGLMGNGKFGICVDSSINPKSEYYAYVLLHELIHMALVRKDELFLPNIGMTTKFQGNEFAPPYWINEISTIIYNDNITNKYPAHNTLTRVGPHAQETFYAMCVNRNPFVPKEWWGVSSLKQAYEQMREIYTIEDFEKKFQNNMNFIGNILKIQPNPTIDMFMKYMFDSP
jgi:hypothetical protein